MQKRIVMVLDTETATLQGHVYDIGYVIMTRRGEVLTENTALVRETFTDQRLMRTAYYGDKVFTEYMPRYRRGEIDIKPWAEIAAEMRRDALEYGVNTLAAYNANFDLRVMRQTNRMLGGQPILPPVKRLCIWHFVCRTLFQSATFRRWAIERGYVSDAGNIRTSAEIAYRYLTGDWDFVESHTALHDAQIEAEILTRCFAQRKRIPDNLLPRSPWRLVAPVN